MPRPHKSRCGFLLLAYRLNMKNAKMKLIIADVKGTTVLMNVIIFSSLIYDLEVF